MADFFVDDENETKFEEAFEETFASFDDASSALSEREDFLLVLVSSLLGNSTQGKKQTRALTIIAGCGIQPEILDAADPGNALVRDELCGMSGIRGAYPQFFLVQGDRTSFFADYAELEHMNEEGTLDEWLSMELPIAKSSPKTNQAKEVNEFKIITTNDDRPHKSRSNSLQDDVAPGVESDHEYAASSATEDFLSVEAVSEIMNSFNTNDIIAETHLHHKEQCMDKDKSSTDDSNRDMSASTPTIQDEWSDPSLHTRFEDEILALEDYILEREEEEVVQHRPQEGSESISKEEKRESERRKMNQKIEPNCSNYNARSNETDKSQSPIFSESKNVFTLKNEAQKDFQHNHDDKFNSASSLSSTATTATISPTSSASTSRSPERHREHKNLVLDNNPNLPTPPKLLYHNIKNTDKGVSCNVSMETISSRPETEQVLRAELEELGRKCEGLTAERYRLEGQLKEARQRNHNEEQRSSDRQIGTVHKYQLQQTMRCPYCTKVFSSNLSSLNAPIASQACGHSVCRNCVHERLSTARRHRDESTMNSSERLRNTITSDLFMCGNMSHVYSSSFEDSQRQLHESESCPICSAPRAFRQGKLHVNESLCIVLKLLDN